MVWFVAWQWLDDWKVILAALCGAIIGLIVDAIFLSKWIANAYDWDLKIWMVIFLFYSMCIFGFFMGVPVVNLVLAVPAGLYMVFREAQRKMDLPVEQDWIRRTQKFTTVVFGLVCVSSAAIALYDPYTADNLEGCSSCHLNYAMDDRGIDRGGWCRGFSR